MPEGPGLESRDSGESEPPTSGDLHVNPMTLIRRISEDAPMWPWVNPNGIPFWGRCTHFRTYLSGVWDVHWGYGVLTHSHAASENHGT